MSGERFVVFLFSIIVIIAFIYYIYKEIKEHQEEEQIRIYEEKRKKEFEKLLATKRKEDSIKWNQKIQRQFKGKVNHKPNKPIKILVGDYHNWMAPLTNGILREMGITTEVVPTASDIIDRIKKSEVPLQIIKREIKNTQLKIWGWTIAFSAVVIVWYFLYACSGLGNDIISILALGISVLDDEIIKKITEIYRI